MMRFQPLSHSLVGRSARILGKGIDDLEYRPLPVGVFKLQQIELLFILVKLLAYGRIHLGF